MSFPGPAQLAMGTALVWDKESTGTLLKGPAGSSGLCCATFPQVLQLEMLQVGCRCSGCEQVDSQAQARRSADAARGLGSQSLHRPRAPHECVESAGNAWKAALATRTWGKAGQLELIFPSNCWKQTQISPL